MFAYRGNFCPGASSLRLPLVALYSFTWYHQKMSYRTTHTGSSSPRFRKQSENGISVRNVTTVLCKRRTTTPFGTKKASRLTGTSINATNRVRKLACKRDTKLSSHPGVKLAPARVFSCKHPLFNMAAQLVHESNSLGPHPYANPFFCACVV